MGRNTHGAYERTCHVHANHEQPVFRYVGFWRGSIPGQYPCVLAYGQGNFTLLE